MSRLPISRISQWAGVLDDGLPVSRGRPEDCAARDNGLRKAALAGLPGKNFNRADRLLRNFNT